MLATQTTQVLAAPLVPDTSTCLLGRYRLRARLAVGGMAEIFLATCDDFPDLAREVVIKRIRPGYLQRPSYLHMFADEARLAARLQHRNIVQTFAYHDHPQGPFMVLEYLKGPSLATLLRRHAALATPLPWYIALAIARDVAAALHYAHELCDRDGTPLEIVHRDVSPGNILLTPDGTVKVIDFGIASALRRRARTMTGMVKGKPGYMAPEQSRGGPVDRRADVFALGVVLFEMTTATKLFRSDVDVAAHAIAAQALVPRPSDRVCHYPPDLEKIVLRALARAPADRYPTARDLLVDLEAFSWAHGVAIKPIGERLASYASETMAGGGALAAALPADGHVAGAPRPFNSARGSAPVRRWPRAASQDPTTVFLPEASLCDAPTAQAPALAATFPMAVVVPTRRGAGVVPEVRRDPTPILPVHASTEEVVLTASQPRSVTILLVALVTVVAATVAGLSLL